MTANDKPVSLNGGVLKNLVGLFVIWLSLYLVALAHDLSSPESKRHSSSSPAAQLDQRIQPAEELPE